VIALAAHARGAVLAVKAQPGARRNTVLGERAGALRVAVTAAPERGRANDAIVAVLAAALDVKMSRIHLLTGETSRDKRFVIEDITVDELKTRLDNLLQNTLTPNPSSG
jgi:hypothetical protein